MAQRSKRDRTKKISPKTRGGEKRFEAEQMAVSEKPNLPGVPAPAQVPDSFAPRSWPFGDWMIALLLVAVVFLVYAPAMRGEFFWDDEIYITACPAVQTPAGLRAIWLDPSATCQYYPLSFTCFWALYQLCGLNPLGFHLMTVLLHGVAAVLLWQVLAHLRVRGALLAGAIFALHPVNVMSVALMCELKNTLSGSLALGATWAYVRFAGLGVYEQKGNGVERTATHVRWWYALALSLFLLAMLAKTAVSFLPVTLFLIVWWQRERISRRDILSLIPMLAISIGMGAFTIYIERHAGGASGSDFTIGFTDRLLISGRSFWFYLWKLVWPFRLMFIYPRWTLNANDWSQWLLPGATVSVLVGSWMIRRRIGKGAFVALTHFYISTSMLILAVVLYMMLYTFVSDHWLYFGSLSMIALIASAMTRALDHTGKWSRTLKMGLGIGLVAGLGVLTWRQSGLYSDIERLWRTTIARNPECWVAYNNLGSLLTRQGRMEEADANFRRALQIRPQYADAHNNLGNILSQQGRTKEAMAQFNEALRINPAYVDAHYNLGNALLDQGQIEGAITQFSEALKINPGHATAHSNLGNAFLQQGRMKEAIAEYIEALKINPSLADAHYNLGNCLVQRGQIEEAIAQYHEALQINPRYVDALNNLGNALLDQGRTNESIVEFNEALKIDPAYANAHTNLGNALLVEGRAAEAISEAEKALAIRPADAGAQNNVAWMRATLSRESLRDGARAVQLATLANQGTGGNNPVVLRTLAAAHAQAGQFPDAVKVAQKALELAQSQGNTLLAKALDREIRLYEAGQPFREGP